MSRVTESDERVLIEAAQQNPARFAELYERHFHRVFELHGLAAEQFRTALKEQPGGALPQKYFLVGSAARCAAKPQTNDF